MVDAPDPSEDPQKPEQEVDSSSFFTEDTAGNTYFQPFGENGPKVRILSAREQRKPGSSLRFHEHFVVLKACPSEGDIGIHTLIMDRLRGGGAYGSYQQYIDQLVKEGFLNKDVTTGRVSLTEKGKAELHD